MKAKVYKTICLIVALAVAVFTVGCAFAWLIDRRNSPFEISGASAGAYFDSTSGDGTAPGAGHAFIIANSTHMRNLAVLQNSGRFRGNKYYFEIKESVDEIDMDGLWLPPIGNDENPFISNFNGKGKTIKNLKVTTDKSLLTKEMYPIEASDSYEFSNAVGLFGNTEGTDCQIRNFILDNPVLLVGGKSSTKYSEGGNKVVGLAVGHVEGLCQSIGVRATDDKQTYLQIVDRNTQYSTFNSILGELGQGVESSVTGGGHIAGSGGSGEAYGASFDVDSMLTRLQNIYKGKYGVEYKKSGTPIANGLPLIDTANDYPVPAEGEKVAFTVDDKKSSYEYNASAKEVVGDENIGYFLGNQNKIQKSNITYSDPLIAPSDMMNGSYKNADGETPGESQSTPRQLFKVIGPNQNYQAGTIRPLTDDEFSELPDGVKSIIPSQNGTVSEMTIRLQQRYSGNISFTNTNQNDGWAYHGQVSYRGKTYGEDVGFKEAGGIALPNNAIWFKPANVGKFRFVMYTGSNGRGFKLIKITRNGATKANPFAGTDLTGTIVTEDALAYSGTLPYYLMLYFEYDMSDDEIEDGNVEFMLTQGDGNGAYFVYLDIGASAAEDASAVVPDKVSAVDFIYTGVEITQEDVTGTDIKIGDFIVNASGTVARYDSSKTSIYFENLTAALKIVYVRLHNEDGKHAGKTICLEGSTPALSTDSEVHATFATYVCPTISGGSGTVSGGGGGGTVTPTPDPTPSDTVTQTANISGAKTAGDVLLTVKDADGNTISTATLQCGGGAKTGGSIDDGNGNTETGVAHIQTDGSPCIKFELAEGYTYTITIYAGSSGSGTRNITLNGETQESGAGNVCKAVTWNDIAAGNYDCTTSGNIRIARIVITATPE